KCVCRRTACRHHHKFLLCRQQGQCFNKCKFFHLSEGNFDDFVNQRRPFIEDVQNEVNRVAYVYLNSEKREEAGRYCSGTLTGGKCDFPQCVRCFPNHDYPTCNNCRGVLLRGITYRLNCMHLVCEDCINKVLPVQVTSIMTYECPVCKQYGVPSLLY
ncbi:hypothetical protein RN001_002630, partial [Aquatica leii]